MDWFKGKFEPETPIFNGKNHGFRFRFSLNPMTGSISYMEMLLSKLTCCYGHKMTKSSVMYRVKMVMDVHGKVLDYQRIYPRLYDS